MYVYIFFLPQLSWIQYYNSQRYPHRGIRSIIPPLLLSPMVLPNSLAIRPFPIAGDRRREPEWRPSARGSLGGPRARGSATGGPPAVRGSGPRPRGQPLPARGSGDWRREPEWRSGSALHPPRPQRPPDRRGEEKKKKKKMFYKIKMNGFKMKLSYFTDKMFLTTLVSCDCLFCHIISRISVCTVRVV